MRNPIAPTLGLMLAASACAPDQQAKLREGHSNETLPSATDSIMAIQPEANLGITSEDQGPIQAGPRSTHYNETQLIFHTWFTGIIGDQPGQGIDSMSCATLEENGRPELSCKNPTNDAKEKMIGGIRRMVGGGASFDEIAHLDGVPPMLAFYSMGEAGAVVGVLPIKPEDDDVDRMMQNMEWNGGLPYFPDNRKCFIALDTGKGGFMYGIVEGEGELQPYQEIQHNERFIDSEGGIWPETLEILSDVAHDYVVEVSKRDDLDFDPAKTSIRELRAGGRQAIQILDQVKKSHSIRKGELPGETRGVWVYFKSY